jgi:hypothetical protein
MGARGTIGELIHMKSISCREIRTTGVVLLMILAAGCSGRSENGGNAINNSWSGDDGRGHEDSMSAVRVTERDHGSRWESERDSEGT